MYVVVRFSTLENGGRGHLRVEVMVMVLGSLVPDCKELSSTPVYLCIIGISEWLLKDVPISLVVRDGLTLSCNKCHF